MLKLTGLLGSISITIFSLDQITLALGLPLVSKAGAIAMFIFLLFASFSLLSRQKDFKITQHALNFFALFGLFCLISLLSVFSSEQVELSIYRFIQFSFFTVWLFFIYLFREQINLERSVLLAISFATVSMFLILAIRPDLILGADNVSKRLIFEGLGINAISVGYGYLIILTCLSLFSNKVGILKRLYFSFFLLLSVALVIKSGTRSVAVGIPVAILCSYLTIYRKIEGIKNLIYLVIAMVISTLVAINTGLIGERVLERLLVDSSDFSENGRVEVWFNALGWYSENLSGSGFGTELEVFKSGSVLEAHNTLISILLQTSVFGLVVFCSALLALLKLILSASMSPTYRLMAFTLFMFLSLQLFKGTFHHTRLFFIPVAWILLMCGFKEKNKSDY